MDVFEASSDDQQLAARERDAVPLLATEPLVGLSSQSTFLFELFQLTRRVVCPAHERQASISKRGVMYC